MTRDRRTSNIFPGWIKASWYKNGCTVHGVYRYIWSSDVFVVIVGRSQRIICGDLPEWAGWKLSK